jgi:hypothetical protein
MFGTAPASKTTISTVGPNWHFYGTGDFDGDGKSDIVWRDEQTGAVDVWVMNGASIAGTFRWNAPATSQLAGFGDLDGNGRMELLFMGSGQPVASVDLVTGTAHTLTDNGSPYVPISTIQLAGTADFDGDGKSDLLWQIPSNNGRLLVTYMNGTTVASTSGFNGSFGIVRGIGDLDGDKHADILFSAGTGSNSPLSTEMSALLMGARGAVKQTIDMGTLVATPWRVEQVADANGDGRAEVYVRHRQTGLLAMWWLGAQYQLSNFVSIDTPTMDEEMLDN